MEAGKRRTCNLAPAGKRPQQRWSADGAVFASEGDCVAPTPAGSTNICEGGAVAYVLGIRVTAQVPLTHVRRLQPGVSRLQQRRGRLVSVQTPCSAYFAPDKS